MTVELSSARFLQDQPEDQSDSSGAASSGAAIALRGKGWSIGLTIVCFLSALFGLWGLGSSAVGLTSVLSKPDEALEREVAREGYQALQLYRQTQEVTKKFMTARLFFYIVKFGLSVALMAGCILLVLRASNARSFMVNTCGAAIAFHLAGAVLSCLMFISMSGTIEEASRTALTKSAGHVENADEVMSQFMGALSFGALIATFIGLAFKGGVYGGMLYYLTQPFVRAVFGEDPYPEYEEMKAKADAGIDPGLV